ncbi:hypothetical protein EV643_11748 [Kribbella sp. VKM Ac-2527]|uniref:Uncharacterized protein n=1 Tax=Kribbella caucasensis TaxID=2512215 RepID=A0A4R6K991_9ACTN|nr:hypothetical protein [Kribbella sp. VKM Ac-2527]TDO44025.1 hypothetical protein EV643_11748 [Kribbella sp. VKM Ac-2527]
MIAGTVLAADSFSASDPSWAKAVLVRLTAQGRAVTPLRYARATQTFGADEILTTELSQSRELLVLPLGSRIDNAPVAMTKAVTSTDDGRSWQAFEPR